MAEEIEFKVGVPPERDLSAERDARCAATAKKILTELAAFDGPMGGVAADVMQKAYDPLVEKVLTIFLAENTIVAEADYVFRLIMQRIDHVKQFSALSINKGVGTVLNGFWGKPEEDVTFTDLDKLLKKE